MDKQMIDGQTTSLGINGHYPVKVSTLGEDGHKIPYRAKHQDFRNLITLGRHWIVR